MPHSGTALPSALEGRLSPAAKALPDTDWHVPLLYEFLDEFDATVIEARYSRYLIDLNRPPDNRPLYPGQAGTGLCPHALFDGTPLYADGSTPVAAEIEARLAAYWRPYHERLAAELARLKGRHGHALLYDAHSIAARVPRLFDGRLPVLNLGTAHGTSCAPALEAAAAAVLADSDYTHVVNGRFVGGYITRRYGDPANEVYALQMEIAQESYMDGAPAFRYRPRRAARLQAVLRRVFEALLATPPTGAQVRG